MVMELRDIHFVSGDSGYRGGFLNLAGAAKYQGQASSGFWFEAIWESFSVQSLFIQVSPH